MKRWVPWLLFGTLFFAYSYVNQRPQWNQNSRLDVLHAIVMKGKLAIDDYHTNTGDKAIFNGHYYSEKAPGGSALAFPAFALTAVALRTSGIDIDSPLGWLISGWIATALSVGLITAIGGTCFFLLLARRMAPRRAMIATLLLSLGSLVFPYATMLFSHGTVIGLFLIALWAIDRAESRGPGRFDLLAGFCCGWIVASEYPAIIGAAALFLASLSLGWRHATLFALAAFPPLLLIPAYNLATMGTPFPVGYLSVPGFEGMKEGFFGLTFPKLSVMFQLLFSKDRGLFFWSPILLFGIVGFDALFRASRRLFWLSILVPIIYLLFVSSYRYWDGGWAIGPRHLTAAIPFLAIPAGLGIAALLIEGTVVGLWSLALTFLATFINAMPPIPPAKNVLFTYYPEQLSRGHFATNLGSSMGLNNSWSIALFLAFIACAVFFLLRNTVTHSERETLK